MKNPETNNKPDTNKHIAALEEAIGIGKPVNGSLTFGSNTVTSNLVLPAWPTLINHRVTETTVELTYKAEPLSRMHNLMGVDITPPPLVYKEIYSRFDGSMKRVDGKYTPAYEVDEQFEFEDEN